jgi:hypothetical protein
MVRELYVFLCAPTLGSGLQREELYSYPQTQLCIFDICLFDIFIYIFPAFSTLLPYLTFGIIIFIYSFLLSTKNSDVEQNTNYARVEQFGWLFVVDFSRDSNI